MPDPSAAGPVRELLARYQPDGPAEAADLERIVDPVSQAGARVLLRWHQRQQAWLQVGGHGDPGESDPLAIALREAREETGLADLVPWPDAQLRHLAIVSVPANAIEPAHEHADLRFILATRDPDAARPERPDAPLRWLSFPEARELTAEDNLRETLARAERLAGAGRGVTPAQ
jgi:8-oxo-dGTP pyrophosphatase MutT (NUDIX family)